MAQLQGRSRNDEDDADDKLFLPVARSASISGLFPLRPTTLRRQGSHESSSSENDPVTSPSSLHRARSSSPRLHFFSQQAGAPESSPATITTSASETQCNGGFSPSAPFRTHMFFASPPLSPPTNCYNGDDVDSDTFHSSPLTFEAGDLGRFTRQNPFRPPSPYGELVEPSSPEIDNGEQSFDEMDIETMSTVLPRKKLAASATSAAAPHRLSSLTSSALSSSLRLSRTVSFPDDVPKSQTSAHGETSIICLDGAGSSSTSIQHHTAHSHMSVAKDTMDSSSYSLDQSNINLNSVTKPEISAKHRRTSIVDGLLHEIYDRYHLHGRSDSVDSDTLTECSSTSDAAFFHHGPGMMGGGYHAALLERRHASHLNRSFLQNQTTGRN